VEVVGGLASGSLALLSDALHNASDVAALLLAIGARALGRRTPTRLFSYGFRRLEVVAALVNAADAAFAPACFHHVHAWTVGPGQVALTAHAKLEGGSLEEAEARLAPIRTFLAERWDIHHVTLEPESERCSGKGVPETWKTGL
jgi:Co/Zn/Cd efflux system component